MSDDRFERHTLTVKVEVVAPTGQPFMRSDMVAIQFQEHAARFFHAKNVAIRLPAVSHEIDSVAVMPKVKV